MISIDEINRLKEENAKLNAIIDSYQPRLQRYKDILQEIKQVTGVYNEIIQKITKAEEE